MLAAIDAGGTTFKCALAAPDGTIAARRRVPTVSVAATTISECAAFFREALGDRPLEAIGVASFGPLDVDPASPTYGALLDTPKPGWAGVNLKTAFETALSAPVVIDTDVNGALLAETKWGALRDVASAAYVTVGTGIGAGILADGRFLGRPSHPEFGHIRVRRRDEDRDFPGLCPFHGDCLEGLASARAFAARHGEPAELPVDHPGWAVEADYLAQACLSLVLTTRVERIALGGGLMLAEGLLAKVKAAFAAHLADYLPVDAERLIVAPGLGDDAGLMGGLALAMSARAVSCGE